MFTELQHCVLFEWARLEKTSHDMDFPELARHLQEKAQHVWPRATLGDAPIPSDLKNLRTKLVKHLGGSQRTDIETHRRRARAILIEHLAWMPSLMPPKYMPLWQYTC